MAFETPTRPTAGRDLNGYVRPDDDAATPEVPDGIPRHGGNGNPKIRLGATAEFAFYTRASGFAKVIEDTYNLERWTRRLLAFGLSRRNDLVLAAAAVPAWEDHDDPARHRELRDELDGIADAAIAEAKGDRAARRGTAFHLLSEQMDAGRDLAHVPPTQYHGLLVWRHLLSPFEILATETFVVHDRWRVGGTFDRLVRLTREVTIRDPKTGKVRAVLPPGTVLIVDLKTGRTSDYFGPAYGGQLASYAGGTPYVHVPDSAQVKGAPLDDGRRPWPGGVAPSQEWAVIPHVPVDSPEEASLVWVDLTVGRKWGELAAGVRRERNVPAFFTGEVDGLGALPAAPRIETPAERTERRFVATMLDLISSAVDEAAVKGLYAQHKAEWRDEFTEAVRARLAELAGEPVAVAS